MSELKPCPLCDAECLCSAGDSGQYEAYCLNCSTYGRLFWTSEQAIAAWNALPRQADIDELRAKCERLEAALKDVFGGLRAKVWKGPAIRYTCRGLDSMSHLMTDDPNTIAVFKDVMGDAS